MTVATPSKSPPRSAPRLLADTFALYRRYPVLFLVLAAAVIVPYQLIALAVTGTDRFSRGDAGFGAELFLGLADWFLVTPLVSALHVHAVAEVRRDRDPRMGPVVLHGLRVLPVVAAATIVSTLGIAVGLLALLIPGIFLTLRWAVVAQAAAIEDESWLAALRRSGQLSSGHYVHVGVFLVAVGVISVVPSLLGSVAFGDGGMSAAAFIADLGVHVLTASFAALASALLYYDLLVRQEPAGEIAAAVRPSFDPRNYSDQDRPKGWYVDPADPDRMRHWGGSDSPRWSGTTRTPRKIKRAWRENQNSEAA